MQAAEAGAQVVSIISCADVESSVGDVLGRWREALEEMIADRPGGWSDVDPEKMYNISTTLATEIMTLDEKHCLRDVMRSLGAQIGSINAQRAGVIRLAENYSSEAGRRVQLAFARLASWQEALVALGADMVDRDELYPRDVTSIHDCPSPCTSCSLQHNSIWKGKEVDKFKCYLSGRNRNNLPSRRNPRFSCEPPKRRTWMFWQWKTWCTVPSYTEDFFENARIAAMVTCGLHSLQATMRVGAAMPDDVMRICMLTEQRMVVTDEDLQAYTAFMSTPDDGVVPMLFQYAFGTFLSTATALGLAGLRDETGAFVPATAAADKWGELLKGSDYTLLTQDHAFVDSENCRPPPGSGNVFLGGFASLVATGSARMLAVLSSMPSFLLAGFYYVFGLIAFLGFTLLMPGPGIIVGIILAFLAQSEGEDWERRAQDIFTRVYVEKYTSIYNFLKPRDPVKACPWKLLIMNGSPTICVAGMEKLEAKRYQCPADSSRSVVVSCEPEFGGRLALRGGPC